MATNEEIIENLDESKRHRSLKGYSYYMVFVLGVIMSIFHVATLNFVPIDPWIMRTLHLLFAGVLIFALIPASKRSSKTKISPVDVLLMILVLFVLLYILVQFDELIYRIGTSPTKTDVIVSTIGILLVLEMTRRLQGLILPMIAIAFILYSLFGAYFPGLFWHKGYSFERTAAFIYSQNGIFGIPIGVSATFVFLFCLFGSFLQASGGGKLFIDLAFSLAGASRGGPAKVAVIASALFGTINGSSVGNVVTTGTFTIPLIKQAGYSPRFAGAVEAVASTGGQIMPPIMGAGAFIMAEILGIPYLQVALAAAIPAVLYFLAVFVMVHMEANRLGIKGMSKDQLPNIWRLLKEDGYMLIPVFLLLYALIVLMVSPLRAASYALLCTVIVSWFKRKSRMGIKKILEAFYDGARGSLDVAATTACAGIIIGVVSLSGIGMKFATIIMSFANGSLGIALVATTFVCIVLGMGLPTVAAYAIAASILAPALVELGANPVAAHMFILYFASISAITPPVALAAFAGAAIADAKPMDVGFTAFRLGIASYIIPFMFVYGPSLLFQGSISTILLTIFTSVIGIVALSGASQGWFWGKANIVERILLFIASLSLIKPGIYTDILGVGLMLTVFALQKLRITRTQSKSIATES
ncbi:TRAP transporter fused permease subunit [Thermanaerosceptrum fracticalcis]|uniref:TRAP transporter fused permease subunit n=1 Tax=Thermanaerosceptrum fracticalcis TaxID=1712410 RepID=A0A7G6DZD2_THEFR|nr:TRAP transporter permease [Thermanaerosceptrum fracticalcis]QNB45186.1 TRAP transporter fused permease subunit [Thermanaerosceptrum fracticalcis]